MSFNPDQLKLIRINTLIHQILDEKQHGVIEYWEGFKEGRDELAQNIKDILDE